MLFLQWRYNVGVQMTEEGAKVKDEVDSAEKDGCVGVAGRRQEGCGLSSLLIPNAQDMMQVRQQRPRRTLMNQQLGGAGKWGAQQRR